MRFATDRMDSSNRGEHPLVRVIGASEQRVELSWVEKMRSKVWQ